VGRKQSSLSEGGFGAQVVVTERLDVDDGEPAWPEGRHRGQGRGDGNDSPDVDDDVRVPWSESGKSSGEPQEDSGLRVDGLEVRQLSASLNGDLSDDEVKRRDFHGERPYMPPVTFLIEGRSAVSR
jgi:hypothetical protein